MNYKANNSEFTIVTTFSENGWKKYGYKFAKTMDMYLPKDMAVLLYYEGSIAPSGFTARMQFVSFFDQCGEKQRRFEELAAPHEKVAGSAKANEAEFKFQASRFAHKYYACEHAINNIFTRYLIWIDADVIALKYIPTEFFNNLVSDFSYWSRIDRGQEYPECGFMIWNRQHELHSRYWEIMSYMYDEGNLFQLPEWHDSYIWWEAEKILRKEATNLISFDLGDGKQGHAFVRGVLGEYFDHLKGQRKIFGFSPEKKSSAYKFLYFLFFNSLKLFKKLK